MNIKINKLLKSLSQQYPYSLNSDDPITQQILSNAERHGSSDPHQLLFDFYLSLRKGINIPGASFDELFSISDSLIQKGINPVDVDYVSAIANASIRWITFTILPIKDFGFENGARPDLKETQRHAEKFDELVKRVAKMPSYGHLYPDEPGVASTHAKIAYLLMLTRTYSGPMAGRMRSLDELFDAFDNDAHEMQAEHLLSAAVQQFENAHWLYQISSMAPKEREPTKRFFQRILNDLPGWIDKSVDQEVKVIRSGIGVSKTLDFWGFSTDECFTIYNRMVGTQLNNIGNCALANTLDEPDRYCDHLLKLGATTDEARTIARECFRMQVHGNKIESYDDHLIRLLKVAEGLHEAFIRRGMGGVIGSDILNPSLYSNRIASVFHANGYLKPGEPGQTEMFGAMQNEKEAYKEAVKIAGDLGKTGFLAKCMEEAITARLDRRDSNSFEDPAIFLQILEMRIVDLKPILNTPARIKKAIGFGATREALLAGGINVKSSNKFNRKFIESDLNI